VLHVALTDRLHAVVSAVFAFFRVGGDLCLVLDRCGGVILLLRPVLHDVLQLLAV
jgi:hypothetical protein